MCGNTLERGALGRAEMSSRKNQQLVGNGLEMDGHLSQWPGAKMKHGINVAQGVR